MEDLNVDTEWHDETGGKEAQDYAFVLMFPLFALLLWAMSANLGLENWASIMIGLCGGLVLSIAAAFNHFDS